MSKVRNQVTFAIVPEWVLYSDVSAQAIRLYATLNRHADKAGRAFPSRRRLASLMKCSPKTVDRATAELEGIGALVVDKRKSKSGDKASNLYTVRQTSALGQMGLDEGWSADGSQWSVGDEGGGAPAHHGGAQTDHGGAPVATELEPPELEPLNERKPSPQPPTDVGGEVVEIKTKTRKGTRADGTSQRQLAAKRRREELTARVEECEDCGGKPWTCPRCTRALNELGS